MDYLSSNDIILTKPVTEIFHSVIFGIKLMISESTKLFSQSQVYNTTTKQNVTVQSIRSSKSTKIYYSDNPSLFHQVSQIVDIINSNRNDTISFGLIPNDIDLIRYEEGDYFGRHSDFIPIQTSYFTYYTLLICLDADCEGGQTILYVDNEPKSFDETINSGQWLLFRNDLDHEGQVVKSGHKFILKANLVCTILKPTYHLGESFDKLILSKQQEIAEFKSCHKNILRIHTLADYLFFRDYFKNDSMAIPFQYVVGNFDADDKICTNVDKSLIWFGAADGQTIIYQKRDDPQESSMTQTNDQLTELKQKLKLLLLKYDIIVDADTKYGNVTELFSKYTPEVIDELKKLYDKVQNGEIVSTDTMKMEISISDTRAEIEKLKQTLDGVISDSFSEVINDQKINEIHKTIYIVVYLFWKYTVSESFQSDAELCDYDTPVKDLVAIKIAENMSKISSHYQELFASDKYPTKLTSIQLKTIFTNQLINRIIKKAEAKTISYHAGGAYYCNDNDYMEYTCDATFGFIHWDPTNDQDNNADDADEICNEFVI
jgi:hypothetical protein